MNAKKRQLLIALVLVSVASVSLAMGPQWGDRSGRGTFLARELNLSAEQMDQVQKIRQVQREEAMKLREARQKAMDEKMKKVLTEVQFEKYKSFKAFKKQKKAERRMMSRNRQGNCGGGGRRQF